MASESVGPDADPDPSEFEDLPSTDIETEVHVHFGMTGSFPLRIGDLFFADDGLHVVEYAYITPMFGLGTKKHKREAEAMQSVFDVHGLDEVLLQGDRVVWLNYDCVDRVVVYTGGYVGRPKVTVYTDDGRTYAYRLHDGTDAEELRAALSEVGETHDVAVSLESGTGFSPRESLKRFFD